MHSAAEVKLLLIKATATDQTSNALFETRLLTSEQKFIGKLLPTGYSVQSVSKLAKLNPNKKVEPDLVRIPSPDSTMTKSRSGTKPEREFLELRRLETLG
jgi:hypothetical protein